MERVAEEQAVRCRNREVVVARIQNVITITDYAVGEDAIDDLCSIRRLVISAIMVVIRIVGVVVDKRNW